MIRIEVITVGIFREITRQAKFKLEIEENSYSEVTVSEITIDSVVDILDSFYQGKIKKELYLEDGTRNQWVRILLNGWDTRFLPDSRLTVKNGDTFLIASVLVGG